MSDFIVELKGVQKKFQSSLIFQDVNFGLKAVETVGICGHSGCGKTTLINVLGLLEPLTRGKIFWENQEVTHKNASELSKLRAKIFGYIFQRCNLIPELNVIENILFPKRIVSALTRSDVEFAKNLLKRVRLEGFENRSISTLSGGERQKVAVIRSLINRPKVVIADEPTGSLDEKSADSVMNMIIELCGEYKSALLLITHNPRFAEKMQITYILSETKLKKI